MFADTTMNPTTDYWYLSTPTHDVHYFSNGETIRTQGEEGRQWALNYEAQLQEKRSIEHKQRFIERRITMYLDKQRQLEMEEQRIIENNRRYRILEALTNDSSDLPTVDEPPPKKTWRDYVLDTMNPASYSISKDMDAARNGGLWPKPVITSDYSNSAFYPKHMDAVVSGGWWAK
jgi:hypothetical protein